MSRGCNLARWGGYHDWVRRFLSRCEPDPESECIVYSGSVTPKGYGRTYVPRELADVLGVPSRRVAAHRVSYLLVRGEFALDETLDHVCLRHDCVNPYHLEVMSRSENSRDGSLRRWEDDEDPWSAPREIIDV